MFVSEFSLGTQFCSTNKTDSQDITEILLKVVLNTITVNPSILISLQPYLNIHVKIHVFSFLHEVQFYYISFCVTMWTVLILLMSLSSVIFVKSQFHIHFVQNCSREMHLFLFFLETHTAIYINSYIHWLFCLDKR